MSDDLIDQVNRLLELGKGDIGRLEHIKSTIKQGKKIYNSDKKYLKESSEKYLTKNITESKEDILELKNTFTLNEHVGIKKPNDIKIKYYEEPVSRFWSCFFSTSIFALNWTQKMKKTRKWLLLLPIIIFGMVLNRIPNTSNNVFDLSTIILSLLTMILVIYFMFKWTTQYNLKNFGYTSKREWKKHHRK